jgi:predicted TIM-barrel fold metal-dependent hydrolase
VPFLTDLPSAYLKRNFRFTTQPMESPDNPEHLRKIMDVVGWNSLLFSSDYPHWDQDDPAHAFPLQLTRAERDGIFSGNAAQVYRLN